MYSEVAGVQIDYIAASGDIMVFANTAAALDDVTPAVQEVDHVPVAVGIELRINPCAITKSRRRMPFDRSELAIEDVAQTIRAGLAALPVPDRTFEQSYSVSYCQQRHHGRAEGGGAVAAQKNREAMDH